MRVYWMEARNEFLKLLRMKQYSLSTVLFPLMFYAFFGLAMGRQPLGAAAMPMARYLLATYGAFAVMGASLYAFGVGVAVERGLGWLEVKRASPMPPAAYFLAKAAVSLVFGAIAVTLLFGLGAAFGGVRMPWDQWLRLGGVLVAGAVPFCALGLAIGCFAGPNSAPAMVNMVYLPLAFLAGLWIPLDFLPAGDPTGGALPADLSLRADRAGGAGRPDPGSHRRARGGAGWLHPDLRGRGVVGKLARTREDVRLER